MPEAAAAAGSLRGCPDAVTSRSALGGEEPSSGELEPGCFGGDGGADPLPNGENDANVRSSESWLLAGTATLRLRVGEGYDTSATCDSPRSAFKERVVNAAPAGARSGEIAASMLRRRELMRSTAPARP